MFLYQPSRIRIQTSVHLCLISNIQITPSLSKRSKTFILRSTKSMNIKMTLIPCMICFWPNSFSNNVKYLHQNHNWRQTQHKRNKDHQGKIINSLYFKTKGIASQQSLKLSIHNCHEEINDFIKNNKGAPQSK